MPRDVRSARSFLGQLLEHSAPTIDQREFRVGALNTRYTSINDSADWLFLENEVDWQVYTERNNTSTGATVAVTNGSYFFSFSGGLGGSFYQNAGGFTFEDGTGETYTINRFTTPTDGYFSKAYTGPTAAALTTWKIAPDRFYLPVDCARALAFLNRDPKQQWAGWIPILDRRTEERNLSPWSTFSSNVVYVVDNSAEYDRAPDIGFTATDNTAAGTLGADSDYAICYTTTQEGRESPPSAEVRVTTSSAANHQIVVAGMEDTRDGLLPTGILKNVYIRRLTTSQNLPTGDFYSRWLLAQDNVAEATTSITITTFPNSRSASLVYQNGRKWMKTVWRPPTDMKLRLRYLIRPDPFVADSDVPRNWPAAYHDMICYGAAIDVGTSQGAAPNKIANWQTHYDRLMRQMRAEQLPVPNAPNVRQMRTDGEGGALGYFTQGPVTGNYWGG